MSAIVKQSVPAPQAKSAADLLAGATKKGKASNHLVYVGEADCEAVQREIVETATGRGLVYEQGKTTFDDIGRQQSFKRFLQAMFNGPRRPRLIVRWDEIEKSVSSAASGTTADNTGVSQDMLKVLLTSMEDNGWMGCILVGGPGTGKTLAVCTGNTFGVRSLVGDLGMTRKSLLGESEGRIRLMMDIIRSIGGRDVLFLATANALDTLPAALQRRFNRGIWYFDVPSQEDQTAIWEIQRNRFGLPVQELPDHQGWVGSDICNCCEAAYTLQMPIVDAAQYITLAGRTARADIEKLRDMAEQLGFLSANQPGQVHEVRSPGRNHGSPDLRQRTSDLDDCRRVSGNRCNCNTHTSRDLSLATTSPTRPVRASEAKVR